MKADKKFEITYELHFVTHNVFGKIIIVYNCMNELHAKLKLKEYLEKKYGKDLQYIKFSSVVDKSLGLDSNLFSNDADFKNIFSEIFKPKK